LARFVAPINSGKENAFIYGSAAQKRQQLGAIRDGLPVQRSERLAGYAIEPSGHILFHSGSFFITPDGGKVNRSHQNNRAAGSSFDP
jgi:hypothetical protein